MIKENLIKFGGSHQTLIKILSLISVILVSILIFIFRDKLAVPKEYGYFGLFLVSVLSNATIILPVPTILTAFLAGSVFNPILVGIISASGAAIGEITGYLAGRSGSIIVKNQKIFKLIQTATDKYGLWVVFVLAIIPNPFFDLAGITAGATKIPFWKYFLVTWAGKIVKFIFFALLGTYSLFNL